MKLCSCGNLCEDNAATCPKCGKALPMDVNNVFQAFFTEADQGAEWETYVDAEGRTHKVRAGSTPAPQQTPAAPKAQPATTRKVPGKNGNVLLGILGALAGSLVGVVVYFILFQMDTIAGLSVWAMYYGAGICYDAASKSKDPKHIMRMVVAVVVTVVMIFVAQYLCVVFEYVKHGWGLGRSFGAAAASITEDIFVENLAIGYLCALAVVLANLYARWKAKRQAKKMVKPLQ